MNRVLTVLSRAHSELPHIKEDQINQFLSTFMEQVRGCPPEAGLADALFFAGTVYREVGMDHDYEAYTLMANYFRQLLYQEDRAFDILNNLCNACMLQKSFEEAYHYGKMAEAQFPNRTATDADFLANMTISCTLSGRDDEAREKYLRLCEADQMKAATVTDALRDGLGFLQPTQDQDCYDILEDLRQANRRWNRGDTLGAVRTIRESVAKLSERPDGIHAWECWDLLMRFYLGQSQGGSRFAKFEFISHMAAAGGKMVAFWPHDKPQDPQKLLWYAQALVNMNLDHLARSHLLHAQTLPTSDPNLHRAIAETLRQLQENATFRRTVGPVGSERPRVSEPPTDAISIPVSPPPRGIDRTDPNFIRRPSTHPIALRYFADRQTYDTACMVDNAPMTIVEGSRFSMQELGRLQGGFRCGNCGRVTCYEHADGDMQCECGAVDWQQCSYIYSA